MRRSIILMTLLLPGLALAAPASETATQAVLSVGDRMLLRLESLLAQLPLLGVALLIILLAWWLARRIGSWERPFNKVSDNGFVVALVRQAAQVAVFIAGLLIALDVLNATAMVGAVLGTAGVVGLAVGFAFKDVVENYLAGVLLSLRQPFAPNDHVKVDGYEGKIVRLTSRATILLTFDGNHVRIPNATVFKSSMTNFTRNPLRRFDFALGVGPDTDLVAAQDRAMDVLSSMQALLDDPGPAVLIEPPGDFSINLHVYAWVDQRSTSLGKAKGEAVRLLLADFTAAGIDMPEPTQRLHLLKEEDQPAAPAAAASAAKEQDTAAETELDDQIARDRAADASDLLDAQAQRE